MERLEKFANQNMLTLILTLFAFQFFLAILVVTIGPVLPSIIFGAVVYHYLIRPMLPDKHRIESSPRIGFPTTSPSSRAWRAASEWTRTAT